MIPVPRPDEPKTFDDEVRQPGKAWLDKRRRGRAPSHWRKALPELQAAFNSRCGYTAMLDRAGTVDHLVAQEADPALLYEWSNLRYASHWINASKQDAEGVLDPYEVEDGWFELDLPSLQLVATDRVPKDKRAQAEQTLRRLPIRDDERVIRQRQAWLDEYEKGLVTLEGLREYAPLVAAAVEKRDQSAQREPTPRVPKARAPKAGKAKARAPKASKPKARASKARSPKAGKPSKRA